MTNRAFLKHTAHLNRLRSEGRIDWEEFVGAIKKVNKYKGVK